MIKEYYRPETIEEAINLIKRENPTTIPLIGNITDYISTHHSLAVVDLQSLGLDEIVSSSRMIKIGAAATLQQMLENEGIHPALKNSLRLEMSRNLRNTTAVAGVLIQADGRSPFSTCMLALSASLSILPDKDQVYLGDFFPQRESLLGKRFIIRIAIPANVILAFQYVARTPADFPLVCAAVVRWPSGRTRVALGGFGSHPRLAMDGLNPLGSEKAAESAFHDASDQWASAEYRRGVAPILVRRCLEELDRE
jgi:CO/xanthine dehydrogenase FAD-binding subunit